MRRIALIAAFAGALAAAGCNEKQTNAVVPPAVELTNSAIGHYCGMSVLEHSGPKAQIILASRKDPVWFSSARDAFSFTMLPEEPKDIRAIYVSDMGKAPSWDKPGRTNWIDAKSASFVVGSRMKGGMGADEAVPFLEKPSAETFAKENGGRVVSFAEMPRDYVLGAGTQGSVTNETGAHPTHATPVPGPAVQKNHMH